MPHGLWTCGCGETFPTQRGVQNHQRRPTIRQPATPFSAVRQGAGGPGSQHSRWGCMSSSITFVEISAPAATGRVAGRVGRRTVVVPARQADNLDISNEDGAGSAARSVASIASNAAGLANMDSMVMDEDASSSDAASWAAAATMRAPVIFLMHVLWEANLAVPSMYMHEEGISCKQPQQHTASTRAQPPTFQ